jgi:hypothetical protein
MYIDTIIYNLITKFVIYTETYNNFFKIKFPCIQSVPRTSNTFEKEKEGERERVRIRSRSSHVPKDVGICHTRW